MSWNDPDFLKWAAMTHAKLGTDIMGSGSTANSTATLFTVPANHIYLLRHAVAIIRSNSVDANLGTVRINRGGLTLLHLGQSSFPAVGIAFGLVHDFAYPYPLIEGDKLEVISASANITAIGSYHYTDVDLTKFPFA